MLSILTVYLELFKIVEGFLGLEGFLIDGLIKTDNTFIKLCNTMKKTCLKRTLIIRIRIMNRI